MIIGERTLLGRDAASGEEITQIFMNNIQSIYVAEVLKLFFHSLPWNVLLEFLNEPIMKEKLHNTIKKVENLITAI